MVVNTVSFDTVTEPLTEDTMESLSKAKGDTTGGSFECDQWVALGGR